ncbi:hypothetical protein ATCC90586_008903 [Pythium insidiosum]|nr:hypothetical protein ATCC90586_008903 [Pythium insidiosum]
MDAKAVPDDRFYTPRSSARRGYSSNGSEDERFVSPRSSARSRASSSDDNDYVTPRETGGHHVSTDDAAYYKRQALGGAAPKLGVSSPKLELRGVEAAPPLPDNDVFSAARHNRVDSVAYMLDQGVSVNARDAHGNTILSIACQNGLKRMAKLALRRGANINSQNNRGNTALHFCFAYGYGDSLGEYLLSKGADATIMNDAGLLCFDGIDPRSPRK